MMSIKGRTIVFLSLIGCLTVRVYAIKDDVIESRENKIKKECASGALVGKMLCLSAEIIKGKDNKEHKSDLRQVKKTETDKKKKLFVSKIPFLIQAAVAGAFGVYYNKKTSDALDDYNSYKKLNTQIHDKNWKEYEEKRVMRNTCYGLAGVFSFMFVLSIPF